MLELQQLENILEDFESVCRSKNISFERGNAHVVIMANGEEHRKQAGFIKDYRGHSAIYIFWLTKNNICLKVGNAGENSDARIRSHHYCPTRATSSLSKSILNDEARPFGIPGQCIANKVRCQIDDCPKKANNVIVQPEQCIGDWIKDNTQKVIYFFPIGTPKIVQTEFEEYIQSILHPLYEG